MVLYLRAKSTVREGIVVREGTRLDRQRYVEYEPGNGTRYAFLFVDLGKMGATCRADFGLYRGEGGTLVTWANKPGHPSMVVAANFLSPDLVREKLSASIGDAVVIAELLGEELGCDHMTCEEYVADQVADAATEVALLPSVVTVAARPVEDASSGMSPTCIHCGLAWDEGRGVRPIEFRCPGCESKRDEHLTEVREEVIDSARAWVEGRLTRQPGLFPRQTRLGVALDDAIQGLKVAERCYEAECVKEHPR